MFVAAQSLIFITSFTVKHQVKFYHLQPLEAMLEKMWKWRATDV